MHGSTYSTPRGVLASRRGDFTPNTVQWENIVYGARRIKNKDLATPRWAAIVTHRGKKTYLGCYRSEEEASEVARAWIESGTQTSRSGPEPLPSHVARVVRDAPLPESTPSAPTTARPGTPEKIEVLAERAARHTTLWHQDDPVVPVRWVEIVRYVNQLTPETA